MKTSAPLSFGDNVDLADCYLFTLADGTVFRATNCDRRLTVATPQSNAQLFGKYSGSGTPRFMPMRIARGKLSWTAGVKPNELQITIGVGSTDKLELGLDWRVAVQRGLLDWAQVRVWRAYGGSAGQPFVLNSDGTATAGFSVPLFIGYVASATVDRGKVVLQCYDPRVVLNMMLPRYTFGALCRWTLYNAGDGAHGCPVNRGQYEVSSTVAAGSTRQVLQVPPFAGAIPGPAGPGWFEQGYVVGSRGNANQRASIRRYVPAVQSWIATALADYPLAFYPCADPPGSPILTDISGNNYNGAVVGAVEFGQTNLGPLGSGGFNPLASGMPPPYNTAVKFANRRADLGGGNAYVKLPIPPPWQQPGYAGGVTIEWVGDFVQDGAGTILPGVFDSAPSQNHALRIWSGPGTGQGTGGLGFQLTGEWAQGQPFAPIISPVSTAVHYGFVFRGTQTCDVYVNGNLATSVTTGGQGLMAWGTYTSYGGQDGGTTLGRVEPDDDLGSLGTVADGAYEYFEGWMQGFGIYPYPFSPAQMLAHANAALTAYSTSATATLYLVSALPNQPKTGDALTLYPGCNLTYATCVKKFNAGLYFGGFPTIPDAEVAI